MGEALGKGVTMRYDGSMTVREARARYFADNGFDADGGYSRRWVRVDIGPVPLAIPNTAARRRAVRLHDLHHVATGYETDLRGEAEIGAWELGAGCGRYIAAWVLNTLALPIGLVLAPRRTLRAFRRGRRSRALYSDRWDESLLDLTVDELRRRLDLS